MDFIIVTGMSGAGKSQTIDVLEDMGYYCVDNVPPNLMEKFAELPVKSGGVITKITIVVDVRSKGMFSDYLKYLDGLSKLNYTYKTIFLDCDDAVIAARYKETRRRHPLLSGQTVSLAEAVQIERGIIGPAKNAADFLIDTSAFSAAQLKNRIRELFTDADTNTMQITCMSFGYKFGLPSDSDLVFDVRCLPNPFYIPGLRELNGLNSEIHDYVMDSEASRGFAERLVNILDFLIPLYMQEGKSQLVLSFGCTGGRHRSVVFAELAARYLLDNGSAVNISHRDILKR